MLRLLPNDLFKIASVYFLALLACVRFSRINLAFWALLASLGGLLISAAVWALSAHSGNYHHATVGRRGTIISAIAAFLVGAAPAIVTFFENLGKTVH